MTRKTIILVIVAVVFAVCSLLSAWDVAPRFKMAFQTIAFPCLIFLLYSFHQYRKKSSVYSKLQEIHATGFNFLARVFGVMAIFVGMVFTLWGLSLVLDAKATINVNGVPSADPWTKASLLIIGLVAVVMGVLMLIARPYRPKE